MEGNRLFASHTRPRTRMRLTCLVSNQRARPLSGRIARLRATEKDKCMRLGPYFPDIRVVLGEFGSFVYGSRTGARVPITRRVNCTRTQIERENDRNTILEKEKQFLPVVAFFFLPHNYISNQTRTSRFVRKPMNGLLRAWSTGTNGFK